MKVSVIGPGAMGCLFAARFTQAGLNTTLVDHRPERLRRLESTGISVESSAAQYTAKPALAGSVPAKQDLVLVCTKSHATPSLRLPSGVAVMTLQNGLNNVDVLCDKVQAQHVIAGATYESAWLEREGNVRHTGSGPTRFGAWTACPTKAAEDALTRAGFAVELTDAPGQAIWERVTVGAGVEPLTALLRNTNGELVERREARQLLRDLVVEAAKVAALEGYRFEFSLVERAEQFCTDAAEAKSPMWADVEAGRRTEIEQISGEILARAERGGLPAPRTRVIWQLLTSLQPS